MIIIRPFFRKEWLICHAEIEPDPLEWVQKQEGVWVFVQGMKNPVMSIPVMGLGGWSAAVVVGVGPGTQAWGAVGVSAISPLIHPVGAVLRSYLRRMKSPGSMRKLEG